MILPALLTSAGFNIVICVGFFSLYSILRKQPINLKVYFGQRLAQLKPEQKTYYFGQRLVPSAGWLVKAWEASDDDIYRCGGIDGLVFIKMIVFRSYYIILHYILFLIHLQVYLVIKVFHEIVAAYAFFLLLLFFAYLSCFQ